MANWSDPRSGVAGFGNATAARGEAFERKVAVDAKPTIGGISGKHARIRPSM